ncbi:D-alanyl-D-alanine-carboxypeptidase/endopeptidase AmpH [Paludibacterium purpuratum]|uniref:D-alanyl-D-alanine-carboxypeptidase/D-alanyl-D-alanine-endopeptidase n=1 Tax=Paludibacterium purpuratum TaxID=1144873 RepID=A0A4R7BAW6_9NEIS|nr:D-alanyl-D-alanine-carboxypeptidase/endopeptidase AmpH [Paludibacterium purpuratum]TDR82074.1 D-alanyl-D-alanine-carboxypeptidase/D-alanyl-D-alanine-endopeptidase [Paludibacterium purpuratum]
MRTRQLIRLGLSLGLLPVLGQAASVADTTKLIDQYARQLQQAGQPVGLTVVVVDGNQTWQRYLGETRYGNRTPPQPDTLIRIASISKLFTGEVLVTLAAERRLTLDDPLQKYAPAGVVVPQGGKGQIIRLVNLATHTSGLPREMPGQRPADAPVFSWPTEGQRWQWMANGRLNAVPGSRAAYSNLAFDFLADALARAGGKPYPVLLREKITAPLGMTSTTFSPTAAQCARLMQGIDASPCTDSQPADGSGGIYSTPHDMALWLQSQLRAKSIVAQRAQQLVYRRKDLRAINGMDHAGQADALGLGWVYMEARDGQPAMLQKTGGGGGFLTYVAINPQHRVGVFVAMTRSRHVSPRGMINQANKLVAALSQQH